MCTLRQSALVQRKQAHDKTGRAKTALRAVAIHQAALHRVQLSVGLGQVSGSPQGPSVDGVGGLDATVDGPVLQLIPHRLGHHHRASATVTRSAAFFGGAQAQVFTHQVQQGAIWWYIAEIHDLTAMPEAQCTELKRR